MFFETELMRGAGRRCREISFFGWPEALPWNRLKLGLWNDCEQAFGSNVACIFALRASRAARFVNLPAGLCDWTHPGAVPALDDGDR